MTCFCQFSSTSFSDIRYQTEWTLLSIPPIKKNISLDVSGSSVLRWVSAWGHAFWFIFLSSLWQRQASSMSPRVNLQQQVQQTSTSLRTMMPELGWIKAFRAWPGTRRWNRMLLTGPPPEHLLVTTALSYTLEDLTGRTSTSPVDRAPQRMQCRPGSARRHTRTTQQIRSRPQRASHANSSHAFLAWCARSCVSVAFCRSLIFRDF